MSLRAPTRVARRPPPVPTVRDLEAFVAFDDVDVLVGATIARAAETDIDIPLSVEGDDDHDDGALRDELVHEIADDDVHEDDDAPSPGDPRGRWPATSAWGARDDRTEPVLVAAPTLRDLGRLGPLELDFAEFADFG